MSPKNIPLREIERSIAINCAIDKKSNKTLQLPKWQNGLNQGIARTVFIYIAIQQGYSQEEICDYLNITQDEYQHKADSLDDLFQRGHELFHTVGNPIKDSSNSQLHFYRKLVLAQNYLRYRFGD